MYDILTLEPDDKVVMVAVNSIIKGGGFVPKPPGNYQFWARNAMKKKGDGGSTSDTAVIVGHANANSISDCKNWSQFQENFTEVDWGKKTKVYLVACSTNGEGNKFVYGNIATEIKSNLPNAIVWASTSPVYADDQSGDWHLLSSVSKSFAVTMTKQEVFNQLKAGINCEQASGYSISTLKELLSDLQPVNYKWLTYSRDGQSWSAEIKGNSWGTKLAPMEQDIAWPTIVEKFSQAIQAAEGAYLLINPYTPEAVEGLILRVSDAIAAAAKIPYMLKDLMPMYGVSSPSTGFSSGETWTKKDLSFLVEAIESKGFSQTGRSKDFNADQVGGAMSIPEPVTVNVNGTMTVEDYKACSMVMAVCQNMVQKTLTDAAREAGVPAANALKDMNAWVQAYVDFPFPFFTFKDTQNKTYQKNDFSLNADPDVVENIVNIKNVDGLKDAVVGALRKSGGNLGSYEGKDTKFNYFGVITAYNETEISTRVIKFQMNLKTTVVKTLCGGVATTNLDTSYDTYQFVADKELMIKMQAKMGNQLVDYFAAKLLTFIQNFYDEQLGKYKQNLTELVKNIKQ